MSINPLLKSDFPDVDAIRIGDTYYIASTTMHYMPGGAILKSHDLVNWELVTYLYDTLEDNARHNLEGSGNVYGQGMWAPCLRYHQGKFYVCFTANDSKKTYLFVSEDINGPWEKRNIEGFYHDNSILFDDDGRVYIVYGNKEIYITELDENLTGPKPSGLHRLLVKDTGNVILGYEGTHIYKINNKYYLFFIHWPADGERRRTEACFVSDSLEGEFIGRDVLNDDMGYHNQGVAQGGIIDTPEGKWYALLFQDRGAVGRIPVLVPVSWDNDFPVFGVDCKVPKDPEYFDLKPGYAYKPVVGSDDFKYNQDEFRKVKLKDFWQWNHNPNNSLWSVTEKADVLRIRTNKLAVNLSQAVNCLTQRTLYPSCEAEVTIDGSGLLNGDFAGLGMLQYSYGLIALKKEEDQYYIVVAEKGDENLSKMGAVLDDSPAKEIAKIKIEGSQASFKVFADFEDQKDEAEFFYKDKDGNWTKLGIPKKLYFHLQHFVGARIGLFIYSTIQCGGNADFSNFIYRSEGKIIN